ncbi:MAG: hypothetical protein AABZ32_08150 [Bacteroidota bacterium]
MAKVTVRVDIPIHQPMKLMALVNSIKEEHARNGANSPLHQVDMASFIQKSAQAENERRKSEKYRGKAEALMSQANQKLGIDKGQNANTEGTVYNILLRIRDLLLFLNPGREEELSVYGFNVVKRSSSKVGRKRKAKVTKLDN